MNEMHIKRTIAKHFIGHENDKDLHYILSQDSYDSSKLKYIKHWFNTGMTRKTQRYMVWQSRHVLGASSKKMKLLFGANSLEYKDWEYTRRSRLVNCVEYWTSRGHTLEEARATISANQNKNSVKSIMSRTGCTAIEAKAKIEDISNKWHNTFSEKSDDEISRINAAKAVTRDSCIAKYGEDEGIRVWRDILVKKDQTSLSSFVNRYGELEGNARYSIHIEKLRNNTKFSLSYWDAIYPDDKLLAYSKHREACDSRVHFSLEYCIDKYGEAKGAEIHTNRTRAWLDSLYNRPDEEIKDILRRRQSGCNSKSSADFFDRLMLSFPDLSYSTWRTGDGELCLSRGNRRWYLYDFYCEELNLIIEYHGRYWHKESDKESDDDKMKFATDAGYNFLSIFDDDIERMRKCYDLIKGLYDAKD